MKKEFYKLTFVFIMIVFSFSLAFFLGREMALSPPQPNQKTLSENPLLKNQSAHNPLPTHAKQTQKEKVELYKKTLSDQPNQLAIKQPQSDTTIPKDTKGEEQSGKHDFSATSEKNHLNSQAKTKLLKKSKQDKETENPLTVKNPNIKKPTPQNTKEQFVEKNLLYAIWVAQYDSEKPAIEHSAKLKSRFPHWKIFFKKSKDSYKVYIGPFRSKEPAEKFLKELREKPNFSKIKLELLN